MIDCERNHSYPGKPTIVEVNSFLSCHRALIVHFSGTPKGVGPGDKFYPHDLQQVLRGGADGGISCSLVRPGDRFHGSVRHSTGTVGLVVAPTSPESIVAVSPHDAGSQVENGVRTVKNEDTIQVPDLERSLLERGDRYNEWVLRNFVVVGLFIAVPATTWQSIPMPMPDGMQAVNIDQEVCVSVSEIAAKFDLLPIFTFSEHEVLRLIADEWHSVAHSEIYGSLHVN